MEMNFEHKETKTLMQGDSYCDFCYHDSRIDKELENPSEQEYDNVD